MVATALFAAAGAGASTRDEDALAQKYSPVVRLVEQPVECGPGEPYIPLDVDLLFGQPTVALRGPWNTTDLVKIGPSAQDLVNRFEYHLDYPGSALSPGLRLRELAAPSPRGRRLADRLRARGDRPRAIRARLALQYWFFYVFNDFNNTHEGDWEMVQLDFDAADAAEALKHGADRDRLQLARGRRAGRLGRREARARRRDAPGRLPRGGQPREQVRRRPLPRQLGGRGGGLRRHPRAARRGPARREDDSERPGRGCEGVPVDHVRGTLGRAAEGVLQRPDRPEPQDAVDRAHHLVRGLALAKLRSADRRSLRHRRDGLLLQRGRDGFRCRDGPRPGPDDDPDHDRDPVPAARLARETHHVAARRAASPCTPARLGADPVQCRADVRLAAGRALRGHRPHLHPARDRDLARAGGSCSAASGCWASTPRARGRARWCCSWSPSARRSHCSASGSCRPRRRWPWSRSTGGTRSGRSTRTAWRSLGSALCSAPCCSESGPGSC